MTLIASFSKLNGQRALIEAKMKEFEGLRLIGDWQLGELCREEAHSLLDAWFDGQGELAEDIRGGRFLP